MTRRVVRMESRHLDKAAFSAAPRDPTSSCPVDFSSEIGLFWFKNGVVSLKMGIIGKPLL